jgi:hypothetical protein
MLADLGMSANNFAKYVDSMKTYRDKFIAHLDDDRTMHIPMLGPAKKTSKLLYDTLIAQESGNHTFHGAPASASNFYRQYLAEGEAAYRRRTVPRCSLTSQWSRRPSGAAHRER